MKGSNALSVRCTDQFGAHPDSPPNHSMMLKTAGDEVQKATDQFGDDQGRPPNSRCLRAARKVLSVGDHRSIQWFDEEGTRSVGAENQRRRASLQLQINTVVQK